MADMMDKLSSTGAGISRENSLSSLPETECDWPILDTTTVRDTAPRSEPMPDMPNASSIWPMPPTPSEVPQPQAFDMGSTAPMGSLGQVAAPACFFQVAFLGGIEVRSAPDFDAPRTGLVLMQNDIFPVSHHFPGADGRIYLCLADGQGWVFDDSALVPHDPSVVPLQYTGLQQQPQMQPQWEFSSVMLPGSDIVMPQPLPLPGPEGFVTMMAPQLPPPQQSVPQGELLSSTPSSSARAPSPVAWYRVSYLGGINLRAGPSIEAPLTGFTLPQMETFPVAEELPAADGRVYLCLCDGRGWAFDDTALMPLDPSVKKGNWMSPQPSEHMTGTRVLQEVQADALPARRHRLHPQPRGKRGGKRCSRRSQAQAAQAASASGASTAAQRTP